MYKCRNQCCQPSTFGAYFRKMSTIENPKAPSTVGHGASTNKHYWALLRILFTNSKFPQNWIIFEIGTTQKMDCSVWQPLLYVQIIRKPWIEYSSRQCAQDFIGTHQPSSFNPFLVTDTCRRATWPQSHHAWPLSWLKKWKFRGKIRFHGANERAGFPDSRTYFGFSLSQKLTRSFGF